MLKEYGFVGEPAHRCCEGDAPLPRITIRQTKGGDHHPLTRSDVEGVLRFFGEACFYGLRSIELAQGPEHVEDGRLLLGRLSVPGRITIYAQPESPWLLRGKLSADQQDLLRRGGALVEETEEGMYTRVVWPNQTLRDFMLFEVLMHEVGHHMVQQYKGKRTVRVARTKDHEAFADYFAARCREAYQHAADEV